MKVKRLDEGHIPRYLTVDDSSGASESSTGRSPALDRDKDAASLCGALTYYAKGRGLSATSNSFDIVMFILIFYGMIHVDGHIAVPAMHVLTIGYDCNKNSAFRYFAIYYFQGA